MSHRKKLSKQQRKEVERRLKTINAVGEGGLGFFDIYAKQRVKKKQREEFMERVRDEYPLVVRDVRRSIIAQMGLDADSSSASDSASTG
jgi:hypothetical protein